MSRLSNSYTHPIAGLQFVLAGALLTMGACASKGTTPQVVAGANAQAAPENKGVKPASLIDPANPPVVEVSGIKDGELNLNSSIQLKVKVSKYPMESGWQEAVVALNDSVVKRLADAEATVDVSDGLVEGPNRISVYLARSWGEVVKSPRAIESFVFFHKKKDLSSLGSSGAKLASAPGIFLVSPRGTYAGADAKKIAFDFFLPQNQGRRYRVYYILDGVTRELYSDGTPFYFYNLGVGNHNLKIEIVDAKGKSMHGPFAKTESMFRVE
jgi:hypothetical protein